MADKKIVELDKKSILEDADIFYLVDATGPSDRNTDLEAIKKSVFTINYDLQNDSNTTNILGQALNGVVGTDSVEVMKYITVTIDGEQYLMPLFKIVS